MKLSSLVLVSALFLSPPLSAHAQSLEIDNGHEVYQGAEVNGNTADFTDSEGRDIGHADIFDNSAIIYDSEGHEAATIDSSDGGDVDANVPD